MARAMLGCSLNNCGSIPVRTGKSIESESARVISAALQKSPALVELRRIEAAKDIADTLSRSRNVTYLPSGGGQNMLLGLGATGAS